MASKMKWDINGRGVAAKQSSEGGGSSYNGPDLPKGSYPAKIKRMTVHEIASKANFGKPRISVLLEVQTNLIEGKEQYHGAPVWDNLNIIPQSVPFVNAFLHALTDGSEEGKRKIEHAFWDVGPDRKRVKIEKGKRAGEIETHITKIGNIPIESPKGEFLVQITVKPVKSNGEMKPELQEYLPYQGEQPALKGRDDDDDDDLDDDDIEDDDDDIDEDDDIDDDDDDADEDNDEDEDDDPLDGDEDDDDEPAKPVKAASGRGRKPF